MNKNNQNSNDNYQKVIELLEKKLLKYIINKKINENNIIDNKSNNPKNKIIELFKNNIKGKRIRNTSNSKHDGIIGHKLEDLMGIKHNSDNKPDIFGYEMKKQSNKISFGDWSASEYIFSKNKDKINELNKADINLSKPDFLKIFGTPNIKKNNRYSWSGKCVPKYNKWNECGQKLYIDENNNILALYSFKHDKRKNKIIPSFIKDIDILTIAFWSCEKMKKHVNDKFNQKGFFICKKNKKNEYNKICFGGPITFEYFIQNIKDNIIIFDSGMNEDTSRNRSQWRASKSFWDNLITEEY